MNDNSDLHAESTDDTTGHSYRWFNGDAKDEDVEGHGHFVTRGSDSGREDDTTGHSFRSPLTTAEEDDVAAHVFDPHGDADVEGHSHR